MEIIPVVPARASADSASASPWPKANPRRGLSYMDHALTFQAAFPIGTVLTDAHFDRWASQQGLYSYPEGAPKKSDAWKAMLQRRHETRTNINKAAMHPDMNAYGAGAYEIAAIPQKQGLFRVQAPHESIEQLQVARKLTSLLATKRKQINYLLQSQDWAVVPPYERVLGEELFYNVKHLERRIMLDTQEFHDQFQRLVGRLSKAVEGGKITPVDDGIKQLVAPTIVDGPLNPNEEYMC